MTRSKDTQPRERKCKSQDSGGKNKLSVLMEKGYSMGARKRGRR